MNKSVALLVLVFLTASSLPAVRLASGEASVPKPSVPEFTGKLVDNSYDAPTTHSIDPYTGQDITHAGYHVENRTIEISIKNQPFTSYESNGQIIDLYLNIRTKGDYTENWTTIYSPEFVYPTQSKSDYTKISYSLDENEYPFWDNLNQGGIVDFQVEALIGSVHRDASTISAPWVFDGETSGWSNTQTLIIPASTSPTSTPGVPEFSSLAIQFSLIIIVIVVAVGLLFYFKKRKR